MSDPEAYDVVLCRRRHRPRVERYVNAPKAVDRSIPGHDLHPELSN
jgi:hypothetical protein